ncbi:MAG: biotin-dependent carboxyltransferase family protein [Deltaproteobacteria bacterium]|nr:biotin-dependent carboxyltransferase family protein [Deltaproteobacteria bacterium]
MLQIKNGGIETLVEDWPGRLGYLGKGMSASGAFDNVGLGLANILVGNSFGEAGLEITGGFFEAQFGIDTAIAVTGSDMKPVLNEKAIPMWETISVSKGDIIKFSHIGEFGFRSYLAVAGGINVPEYLGSKSTCIFGSYGGFKGRKLAAKDELVFGKPDDEPSDSTGRKLKKEAVPTYKREWILRAMPGANTSPDYASEKGMDHLFEHTFKIQHTSNRSAYRLEELPDNFFARSDGGVGGSHPSNIIDHAYAIRGALNICGNTPILLIADGPTLGGYMCALNVINADLWKIGQGTPGRDFIKFKLTNQEEATEARINQKKLLSEASLL